MVDGRLEHDIRRCIWVVGGEVECKFEGQVFVRRVSRAEKRGGPYQEGGAGWESGNAGCGGHHKRHKFGL